MPLSGTGNAWGTQIANDLLNRNPNSSKLTDEERQEVIAIWELISSDNVTHITANALGVQSPDSNGDTETPVVIT